MSVFDDVRHISAHDAAERAGLPLQREGRLEKACCPASGERHASLKIYPNGGFYCFSCNAGGDAVALYAHIFGLSPLEAARRLGADFGVHTEGVQPGPRKPSVGDARRRLKLWREQYIGRLQIAQNAADAIANSKAAALRADAWDDTWEDTEFRDMLTARGYADNEISTLRCASIDELAAIYAEREPE